MREWKLVHVSRRGNLAEVPRPGPLTVFHVPTSSRDIIFSSTFRVAKDYVSIPDSDLSPFIVEILISEKVRN